MKQYGRRFGERAHFVNLLGAVNTEKQEQKNSNKTARFALFEVAHKSINLVNGLAQNK